MGGDAQCIFSPYTHFTHLCLPEEKNKAHALCSYEVVSYFSLSVRENDVRSQRNFRKESDSSFLFLSHRSQDHALELGSHFTQDLHICFFPERFSWEKR